MYVVPAKKRKPWKRQADRTRKLVTVTLSDEAREALERLSASTGEPKSVVVERLLIQAAKRSTVTRRLEIVADSDGKVMPTAATLERIERAYPDARGDEKFRLAHAATLVELVMNSYSALKKPRERRR